MNSRILLASVLVLGVVAAFTAPAFTGDDEPESPADPMAGAIREAGTPGPDHAWMAFMVGSWDVAGKFWNGPGEPQNTEGRMETHWHLGRRYLRSEYSGEWEGEPFTGEATLGFDKITSRYKSVWIDSMSTNVAYAEGTRKGDVITMKGKAHMPMMGEVSFRTVYTKTGDDAYEMVDFWTMEGQGERKVMELSYTRAQ